MKMKYILGLAVIVLSMAACMNTPKKVDDRQPAQAAVMVGHLSQEDQDKIQSEVSAMNDMHLKQIFEKLRISQKLVSSFDERISKYKTEAEMDKLFQSELYCNLARTKQIHERAEEQLIESLKVAKRLGSGHENWFYDQMSKFVSTADPVYHASMGNAFLSLVGEETEICGAVGCVAGDLAQVRGLKFNPLNEMAFAAYMQNNRKAIAEYGNNKNVDRDLKAGDCQEAQARRKPNSAGFDWVNRNWLGSVLPTGQFVFTYDDGPHTTHTRTIRDAWANSGLAQPAFFWLRKNASALPAIVKELNDQGYVIASHSERHADLGNLAKSGSPADFNGVNKQVFASENKSDFANWKRNTLNREIVQSVDDLAALIGKPVRYFRLPYGSGVKNETIGQIFQAKNLDHFFWRVDSLDWQDKSATSIQNRVVTQMNAVKRGIVLYHDVHPQSAEAAKLMVNYLKTSTVHKAVPISALPGLKP